MPKSGQWQITNRLARILYGVYSYAGGVGLSNCCAFGLSQLGSSGAQQLGSQGDNKALPAPPNNKCSQPLATHAILIMRNMCCALQPR